MDKQQVYESRIAMYVFGKYVAYINLKEQKDGTLLPVFCASVGKNSEGYWWKVGNTACDSEQYPREKRKGYNSHGIHVYEEIVKDFPKVKDQFGDEKAFWQEAVCIHFYITENGEYTITALRKNKWIKNKFSGFIKRIHIPNNYSQVEFNNVVDELIKEAKEYEKHPWKKPVNVEEVREDESIGKHSFPWTISIFIGEKRILIIPYLDHVSGLRTQPDEMIVLDEKADALEIGNGVTEVVDIIKNSPRLVGNTQGYTLATKYKGWKAFSRHNQCVDLRINEDFSYRLVQSNCPKGDGIYHSVGESRQLESTISAKELGKNILECIAILKANSSIVKPDPYPEKSVELSDGSTMTVKHPADKHFEDYEDAHAAEIYQCYCYLPTEGAESSAEFFVGAASEINCNLSHTNIKNRWEEVYGKAESFKVKECEYGEFCVRAEMKNKTTHKISYFLQMEEDLILECGMDVHQPNRRKKLDERLEGLFEQFALRCRLWEDEDERS